MDEHKRAKAGKVVLQELAEQGVEAPPSPSPPPTSLGERVNSAVREVVLEAGAAGAAALATGGSPGLAAAQGAIKGGLKALAPLLGLLDQKLAARGEARAKVGMLAAAQARGETVDDLVIYIVAESDDEWMQTYVRETLRAMLDALDPAAVAPLGRLLAEYLGPPKLPPDRHLRGVAPFMSDASAVEIEALRAILSGAAAKIAGERVGIVINAWMDGTVTVYGGPHLGEIVLAVTVLDDLARHNLVDRGGESDPSSGSGGMTGVSYNLRAEVGRRLRGYLEILSIPDRPQQAL